MFSDAISSICDCWRSSSRPSAAASSGSVSATPLLKKGDRRTASAAAETFIKSCPSMAGHLRGAELAHAGAVAAAFESGVEKNGEALAGDFGADQARAQAEHVGIVMLAGKPRRDRAGTDRRPDMRMTVGRHRNTDAGAANKHAALRPTVLQSSRGVGGEIGIIDGIGAVGAEVKLVEPARDEIGFETFF